MVNWNVYQTPLELEIATAKLKKYKSPGSDKILVEPIQGRGKYYCLR
jgi:hypothetical protein